MLMKTFLAASALLFTASAMPVGTPTLESRDGGTRVGAGTDPTLCSFVPFPPTDYYWFTPESPDEPHKFAYSDLSGATHDFEGAYGHKEWYGNTTLRAWHIKTQASQESGTHIARLFKQVCLQPGRQFGASIMAGGVVGKFPTNVQINGYMGSKHIYSDVKICVYDSNYRCMDDNFNFRTPEGDHVKFTYLTQSFVSDGNWNPDDSVGYLNTFEVDVEYTGDSSIEDTFITRWWMT